LPRSNTPPQFTTNVLSETLKHEYHAPRFKFTHRVKLSPVYENLLLIADKRRDDIFMVVNYLAYTPYR
jgi:hypothetical protein